ncbi:restriction endonuclease subunit S [bacterium]|nr:restriction endonuclease subunit S [bacterium]
MAKKKVEEITIEEKLQTVLIPVDKQPYKIPQNWCWVRLGSVINLYRGVSYGKNDGHKKKEKDDILILRGGNLGEGYIQTETDNVYVNKNLVNSVQIVKKHDVLIVSSTGSSTVIGKAGISHIDYSDVAFGAFLMLARPKEQFNKSYIDYFFLTDIYRHRIRLLANGTNINNVRVEHVNGTTFPLPPLAEQERIVNKLDKYISKINLAKEKLEKVVNLSNDYKTFALLDDLKENLLTRAFGGLLGTNAPNEENSIELLKSVL